MQGAGETLLLERKREAKRAGGLGNRIKGQRRKGETETLRQRRGCPFTARPTPGRVAPVLRTSLDGQKRAL